MIDLEDIVKYKGEIKRFLEILKQYGEKSDYYMLRCYKDGEWIMSGTIYKR